MIELLLIRHGKTEGNLKKRYIGRTDEPLCGQGIEELQLLKKTNEEVDLVFSSPMRRCLESAKILYPEKKIHIYENLKECDFGTFENKSYEDLKENEQYQNWLNSNGELSFPDGESKYHFIQRCIQGFEGIIDFVLENLFHMPLKRAALIIHGGTIMSIMDHYSEPHKDYYCWQVGNGCGYLIGIDEELWIKRNRSVQMLKKFD